MQNNLKTYMAQSENKTLSIKCPECEHEFDQDIEVTIYNREPDVDIELK